MNSQELISELLFELEDLGYTQKFEWKEDNLFFEPKNLTLKPNDLFFVDAGFTIENETILFAINSPLYDTKGFLVLIVSEFDRLKAKGYKHKFDLELSIYEASSQAIVIGRQYDMRKVGKKDFEPDRYELRQGFPDFPACPYGHSFRALGYDLQEMEYVRLASSILKNEEIKTIKYKE